MPELPEVEVVRRGLDSGGRPHDRVRRGPAPAGGAPPRGRPRRLRRAARRPHRPRGPPPRQVPLAAALERDATRRCSAHLGMSGQLLVGEPDRPPEKHLRARFAFADGGTDLRFVDQRTFGASAPTASAAAGGRAARADRPHRPRPAGGRLRRGGVLPRAAPPAYRRQAGAARPVADQRRRQHLRRRGAVAGPAALGAPDRDPDPAGGRARARGAPRGHGGRPWPRAGRPSTASTSTSTARAATSSGRSTPTAGEDEPCRRCGAPIRRDAFMNRSSYSCPACQPRPRRARY